ncbi:MAG: hypothetical protein AMS27_16795, partial [Bacteroides sp. SM23_62_1]
MSNRFKWEHSTIMKGEILKVKHYLINCQVTLKKHILTAWYTPSFFNYQTNMDKNEKYIRDLFKLVGTDSILIIDKQGKLAREYCPLEVIVTVILPDLKIIFQYAILANASSM